MIALNLDQLKVSKNTKSHIWNRHKLTKKRVLNELTYGILDVMVEDEERMAVFTKRYFILIIRYNFYYSSHYKVRLTSKGIKIMDITKQAAFKYDVPMDFKTSKKIIRFVKKRCLKQFYIISFGL